MSFDLNAIIDLLKRAAAFDVKIEFTDGKLAVKVNKEKKPDPAFLGEVKANKLHLIEYFKTHADKLHSSVMPAILRRSNQESIPLSFSQERLWFIDRLHGSVQYHIPWVFRMYGSLDVAVLEASFRTVVDRHEILRTVITETDGVGYQSVQEAAGWKLGYSSAAEILKNYEDLPAYAQAFIQRPYDLSSDYMLRVEVIEISAAEHLLLGMVHHIAFDGWSISIVVKELTAIYRSLQAGEAVQSGPPPLQYADYAAWQRNYLSGELLQEKLSYWESQLANGEPLVLYTDRPRSLSDGVSGGSVNLVLSRPLRNALVDMSLQKGVTLFMTLLAGFKVLLYRYTGQGDICVGTPVAGRQQKEAEDMIGFFVNTLVLRSRISGAERFSNLLERVKQTTLDAYSHQEVPFEKIVEVLAAERDRNSNPLFQVLFTLQNIPESGSLEFAGIELQAEPVKVVASQFDLNLNIIDSEEHLHLSLTYRSGIFDESTAVRMLDHYRQLLESVVSNSNETVSSLRMSEATEMSLLSSFSQGPLVEYEDTTVVSLISWQASLNPGAAALHSAGGTVSYGEMNSQSDLLAYRLLSSGVQPGDYVAICLDSGAPLLISILAVLKAGAAYVPVDPFYPVQRISYILGDCGASVVISNAEHQSVLPAGATVLLTDDAEEAAGISGGVLPSVPSSGIAYLIYTSGSTGVPKGVMITHKSLVHYLFWAKEHYAGQNLSENSRSGSYAHLSFTFDASISALFVPLISGSSVVLGGKRGVDVFEDPLLRQYAPYDFIKLTPAHLPVLEELMGASGLSGITSTLVVGGEALEPRHVSWLGDAGQPVRIINEYGPTEATVGCCNYSFMSNAAIPVAGSGGVLIGKPIGGISLYILNSERQPSGIGIPGELFIGGAQLAAGYLNMDELTDKKFAEVPGLGRLYATGDRGRWLPDGNIEFLGRMDDQVKIRGYRIEPGEVERVLETVEGIRQAVVLLHEDSHGDKRLAGYITCGQSDVDTEAVRQQLLLQLPDYMVPSLLILVEEIPLTINGKVDRKKLLEYNLQPASQLTYQAPRNETEAILAEIWQELLEVEQAGIYDDFFALGGHSLLAIRLTAAIRTKLQLEVAMKDIFDYPTIALLSGRIKALEGGNGLILPVILPREKDLITPLSFSQERLWFIDRLQGSVPYHIPWVFRMHGPLNVPLLEASFRSMVDRHEILRTVITESEGVGYQSVRDAAGWRIRYTSAAEILKSHETTTAYAQAFIQRPYNLSSDYMLRVEVIAVSAEEHLLLGMVHHIAFDGWSISIMVKELMAIYRSLQAGDAVQLLPLQLQYADYAAWQRNYLSGELLRKKLLYWIGQLKDAEPLEVQTDYPRPEKLTAAGGIVNKLIRGDLRNGLTVLSQQKGVTLFMTLLAAFKVLLYRYTEQSDIYVGTTVAGRQQKEIEGLIGFFVNTLVFRNQVSGKERFADLLERVKQTVLDGFAHQEVPFEKIVEVLGVERSRNRNPVFLILFTLQNIPESGSLDFAGIRLEAESAEMTVSQFDLNLNIIESDEGLHLGMVYAKDIYTERTAALMLDHYEELLHSIVKDSCAHLTELGMLGAEESGMLSRFSPGPSVTYGDVTVAALIEAQAAKIPDAVAVVSSLGEMSYKKLNEESNRVCNNLLAKGVRPGDFIGVCLENGASLICSILGVLKAGAAYVPIDPGYPLERTRDILTDCGAKLVISDALCIHSIPGGTEVLMEDGIVPGAGEEHRSVNISSSGIAYVIYTSGSAGKPKGVMITHNSLMHYLLWAKENYMNQSRAEGSSGSYAHLSFTFDASITALFVPLISRKSLVISSRPGVSAFEDPLMQRYAPYDFIKLTPAHLPVLEELVGASGLSALTSTLVVGGEALEPRHVSWLGDAGRPVRIINEYGPTEATVGCCNYSFMSNAAIPVAGSGGVLIGKPIGGVSLYILNSRLQPAGIGIPGEIFIGGAQLAVGYLNRDALTKEKFAEVPGLGRLYATGDRGRWLPDGNIEFLGRVDDQVKINGYRVEPGEVERVLETLPGIHRAVVLLHQDSHGDKRLAGYIVSEKAGMDNDAVKQQLQQLLPSYMVPSLLIPVDEIPLTINGKVDRKKLLQHDVLHLTQQAYQAPRNETEAVLAEIWQELLEVGQVGIHDDFFALGGHSLLAIRLIAAIRSKLELEVAIKDVFDCPTIAQLCERMQLPASGEMLFLPAILPRAEGMDTPLSFAQERLWFIDRLQGSIQYHMPWVFRLKGMLDIAVLEESFKDILRRHEILRTIVTEKDGKGLQQVLSWQDWRITYSEQDILLQHHEGIQNYIAERARMSYDLGADYMLRVELIKVSHQEHVLLGMVHHIAFDGWSISIMVKELRELYAAKLEKRAPALEQPAVQYGDYAVWQRQHLSGELLQRKLQYWKEQLKEVEPVALVTDYPRPAVQTVKGAAVSRVMDAVAYEKLLLLSQTEGVTLYMTLLACFKMLLYRYTGQEDICVGTPVAGRQQKETEGLIGFFINTLAIRSRVDAGTDFISLLQQVKQTMLAAYEHQEVPFEKIVEAIGVQRDMSRNPVFQVMFVLQNTPSSGTLSLGGLTLEEEPLGHTTSVLDLALSIETSPRGMQLSVTYSSELFRQSTIEQMLGHYCNLLEAVVLPGEKTIGGMPLLDAAEQNHVINVFNDTNAAFRSGVTITDLFEEYARAFPDDTALVFEGEQITYAQLNEKANRLARYLQQKGLKTEMLAAICLDRSVDMIVSIFAVLKAGGAYLPVDPEYPADRILYMLTDSGCTHIISKKSFRNQVIGGDGVQTLIVLDELQELHEPADVTGLVSGCTENNLAYVIYTSGSTGNPKGVMIEHRNVVNLVYNQAEPLALRRGISVFQFATFSFDACCHEIFTTLLHGGRLIMAPAAVLLNPAELSALLAKHQVELITLPPSYQSVLKELPPSLKTIISAGEKLNKSLAASFMKKGIRLINAYGPTENTVSSVLTPSPLHASGQVVIGRPLQNVRVYILDESLNPVPSGVPGELYLAGKQVARGYINQPRLTAEKFIADPFNAEKGGRMYKTGDRARWLPDGNIEYLDRMDNQVKIRGYRIEPGEVESILQQLPGVAHAAVVVTEQNDSGQKRLMAYISGETAVDKETANAYIRSRLPDYMIPAALVYMENLPLLPNGKVNRKALETLAAVSSAEFEAPRNETEQALAGIWEALLGHKKIGIHDNFFELGGDSIISIQLISRARRMNIHLTPRDLFGHQTIATLAAHIKTGSKSAIPAAEQELLDGYSGLLPVQQWYFESDPVEPSHFNQAVLLGVGKEVDTEQLQQAMDNLFMHHDALRFIYEKSDTGWKQRYGHHLPRLQVLDLSAASAEEFPLLFSRHCDNCQQSLDIEKGVMACVVLIHTPTSEPENRLLFIIHHLVVDGVSWRILLEDFEMWLRSPAYNPGTKTASYRQWYEALTAYGNSEALLSQQAYWQTVLAGSEPLPVQKQYKGAVKVKDVHTIHTKLEAELTSSLIREIQPAYHTEINDILLAALSVTFSQWTNNSAVVIGLESHGRELSSTTADISNTTGWFTSMYPFRLQLDADKPLSHVIKSVKEALRAVPDKGIGYGVLRYLKKEEPLRQAGGWNCVFNYLGQTDNILNPSGILMPAGESSGIPVSPHLEQEHILTLNCMVSEGRLIQMWSYSSLHYDEAFITGLAGIYNTSLTRLIQHCQEAKALRESHTPSDYGLGSEIRWADLDAFLDEPFLDAPRYKRLQSICRLSGLQQGLLFHSIYDNHGGSYTEQFVCDITNLNEEAFVQSWNHLIKRHSILRTGFYSGRFDIPVQCTYTFMEMPVEVIDLQGLNAGEQEQAASHYQSGDLARKFDFEQPPLMRVSLIRFSASRCRMIWTHHHLIGDGWSQQILMEEFLSAYELLLDGKKPALAEEDRFEDYIRYIGQKPKQQEAGWWKSYMHGLETGCLLPFISSTAAGRNTGVESYQAVELKINVEETMLLQNFARQQKLTVNTIIQGVWSFLLHRYSGSCDVCYGITVSGRPEDLKNIEQRVGMYINTLPFHDTIDKEQHIHDWLLNIQNRQLQAAEFQYSSINEIQKWTGLTGDLFDTLLTFQNYPVSEVVAGRSWKLQTGHSAVHEQTTNYPLAVRVRLSGETLVQFIYKGSIFDEVYVKMVSEHFETVLQQIISGKVSFTGGLRLQDEEKEKRQLENFNGSPVEYPRDTTIVDLIEAQAARTPLSVAVKCGNLQLTYAELEMASGRFANYLLRKGVGTGDFVGICLERSPDMIVAMIGILKAGAAYIPIDPDYPADRISYIVDDSGCRLLVTSKSCCPSLSSGTEFIFFEENGHLNSEMSPAIPAVQVLPSGAAYVIYTSGSTGKPKGVVVDHYNVVRLFKTGKPLFDFTENDVWSVYHSFSFDFSVWEMYGALFYGGCMVIVPGGVARDAESFSRLLVEEKVTVLSQTPGAFYVLQECILNNKPAAGEFCLRYVVFGGEALTPSRLGDWMSYLPSVRMINMYGITETTVHVTYKEITQKEVEANVSNIGRPIPTLACYILSSGMEIQPPGVAGELYVAGAGVARGYLNKPGLTNERFIHHRFSGSREVRLYKSGDLARWLPDGNMEYLGRADSQVKIRGYRIELGEVESAIQSIEGVKQSVVLALEEKGYGKRLVAFVVSKNAQEHEEKITDVKEIKALLKQKLPEYMIPGIIVEVEEIPLTSNGKVNRKKLLEGFAMPASQKENTTPRNEAEALLVSTWQNLLGVEQVSIHDNFFELGGDSIITIQLVSRIKRKGYQLTPRDIFLHQTIEALAAVMTHATGGSAGKAEQGLLQGNCGLLPIQHWYFDADTSSVSHFNQAVILRINKDISAGRLQAALTALMTHHDALRFVYTKTAEGWQQAYGDAVLELQHSDLTATPGGEEFLTAVNEFGNRLQHSLDVEKGILIRAGMITTPAAEPYNRLLLVIHHLAVDGVSWRILLEDLELLLNEDWAGRPGLKTTSYRQWQEMLVRYGTAKTTHQQLPYWQKIAENYRPFKTDNSSNENTALNRMHGHTLLMDAAGTQSLLKDISQVYHTEINDILLAALASTLCSYAATDGVVIGLEGHGREPLDENADTSRTVGWFTSLYPVALKYEPGMDLSSLIKSVKENLRRIPDKGMGYGVLKYLNREAALQGKQPWDIMFNYLGQLDHFAGGNRNLTVADEDTGMQASPEREAGFKISVNAMIRSGCLTVNWTYSSIHFEDDTIAGLAADYLANLRSLINHCKEQQRQFTTPSDYGLAQEIDYTTWDRFLDEDQDGQPRRNRIKSIYRLSPLQEGFLFQSLYHNHDSSYIEQFQCDLINLDTEAFRTSWNRALEKHSILRTGFYHSVFSIPVQCEYNEVKIPFEVIDLRHLDEDKQQQALNEYQEKDKYRPFDFTEPPMMRISLLRLTGDRYRMLWAYHHIIIDGWSKPILIEEVLTGYDHLVKGAAQPPLTEDRYEDYIRYIEKCDNAAEESHWKRYMTGLDRPTMLPFISILEERNRGVEQYNALELLLDEKQTLALATFAQSNHITVNTVIQGVWALLLHKYTGSDNIAFGVTVSGRPDDLADVEQRVGMYINLIPLHSRWAAEEKPVPWLQRLQEAQRLSMQYQYSALNDIQRCCGIQGDLFDTMLTFQNFPVSQIIASQEWQLQAAAFNAHEQTPNYPLSVRVVHTDVVLVQFIYKSTMLHQPYVEMIRSQFQQALAGIITATGKCLGYIEIISSAERQLLEGFNATAHAYPSQRTVGDLFMGQAAQTPAATALVFDGEQLSYRDVDEQSGRLAHYLSANGAKPGEYIAVCLERSSGLIISILAILKCGAAYVPVDPGYPEQRMKYMFEDSGASLMLTHSSAVLPYAVTASVTRIDLDRAWAEIKAQPSDRIEAAAGSGAVAYLMYTSGSTGVPKGVMVTHQNIVSLVKEAGFIKLGSNTVLLSTGSPSFDATTFEYWGPLLNGGRLVMCSQDDLLDSRRLKTVIRREGVNTMWFTAGWFNQLVETDLAVFASLEVVIAGGDRLSVHHVKRLQDAYQHLIIINGYGPTENTTFSLTHRITEADLDGSSIPIGRPLHNRTAYVLDNYQQLCGLGVKGELYTGGAGLSPGYHNQPALTAEKFVEVAGFGRLYRTGDMARWTAAGVMEFSGRSDDQVKIRGYRIEPAEVEHVLGQLDGIGQAVVLVHEDEGNAKRLVGYVVSEGVFDYETVMGQLKAKLPDYMVPAVLIPIDSIPLTANGKVDRAKLLENLVMPETQNEYAAPRTALEAALVQIWQELLEVDRVGIHDDFFALGGHSLLAIRLLSAIRSEVGREVAIRDIFEYTTVGQLAGKIEGAGANELLDAIHPCDRSAPLVLSYGQERLWFIDRLHGSVQYQIPWVFRISGALDVSLLEAAFRVIVDRHESLRTVIKETEGVGYQELLAPGAWRLSYLDAAELTGQYGSMEDYFDAFIRRPYDLSSDYMLRAEVIALSAEAHILLGMVHHIAFDGWSISVIVKELTAAYRHLQAGEAVSLPPLAVQYADYAAWQRDYLSGELLRQKLSYWEAQLANAEPLLLHTDRPRPLPAGVSGGVVKMAIPRPLRNSLVELSREKNVTLFMTLLTAFKVLLYRYTGQGDICAGTPVAGRHQKETEGLIGFFVNTLVLRSRINGAEHFSGLLERVKQTTLDGYSHQDVPFEKIVETLAVERDRNRNPLFQVLFTLQNMPESGALEFGGIELIPEPVKIVTSQFDFNLDITDAEDYLYLNLIYSSSIFDESTAVRMLGHYHQLLSSAVINSNELVNNLCITGAPELSQLSNFSHGPCVDYEDTTVAALFSQQAALTPGAAALHSISGTVSYGELDNQSDLIARHLLSAGVQPGDYVPVCLENGPGLVASVLAVLKCGAAYVPVDPGYPLQRISYILKDCNAAVVISTTEHREVLPAAAAVLFTDSAGEAPADITLPAVTPGGIAYVIYTSGSTGVPKGVLVSHRSLMHYLFWAQEHYLSKPGSASNSGSYAHLSFTFDASITALFVPLISGKSVVLGSKRGTDVFEDSLLRQYAPYDFIKLTPAHLPVLEALMDADEAARLTPTFVVGGEALEPRHISWLKTATPAIRIINEYGPTEATVGCCNYTFMSDADIPSTGSGGVLIGKPLGGVSLYILNSSRQPAGIGIAGEIFIGGPQLAAGYLNRDELTAEKFREVPGLGRLYATGDRGRWLEDGNIEFLGRVDEQVKIRGYRVEPGEVERVLETVEDIRQAVVLVHEEEQGGRKLVGYIAGAGNNADTEAIKRQLQQQLPEYMIPSLLIQVAEIPLTSHGKVDRRKLLESHAPSPQQKTYQAPRNETESILVSIWQDLLGVEQVGIYDNFFELGGDSIITIQVTSRARKSGLEIQVGDLFEYQTIARLAQNITDRGGAEDSKAEQGMLTGSCGLLPIQQWFLESNPAVASHYNQSVLLKISKSVTADQLQAVMDQLVGHHDALRFIYRKTESGWAQEYGSQLTQVELLDISGLDATDFADVIARRNDQYQRELDIEKGILTKAVLIKTPPGQSHNRLLIIIHHLAVDGVSWRILLEDMELLMTGVETGDPVSLDVKTNSYREWYNALVEYGKREQLQGQRKYWNEVMAGYQELPFEKEGGRAAFKDLGNYTLSLDAATTRSLLQEVPKKYHTEINDMLLSALARTVCRFAGLHRMVICLEGHGREAVGNINSTRTAGWFTTNYPVLLICEPEMSVSDLIKSTKEQLRRVPDKGLGYGVLKYLEDDTSPGSFGDWDIVFNYLGQFDNVIAADGLLSVAEESTGMSIAEDNPAGFRLAITGVVQHGALVINWSFSKLHFEDGTVAALAAQYMQELSLLIQHCLDQDGQVFTPSDYGLASDISFSELDEFLGKKKNDAGGDDVMIF